MPSDINKKANLMCQSAVYLIKSLIFFKKFVTISILFESSLILGTRKNPVLDRVIY